MKVRVQYSDREVTRKQIQLLARQGFLTIDIMNELNVSRDTVKKWADTQEYRHHYNTKPKRKLSPNTRRRITGLMKGRVGASVRKCANRLNQNKEYKNRKKTISYQTVQNYLKTTTWGRIARKLKVKPLLTKKNAEDRLAFALTVQMEWYCDLNRHGEGLRENTLWTDESVIELNPKANRQNTSESNR